MKKNKIIIIVILIAMAIGGAGSIVSNRSQDNEADETSEQLLSDNKFTGEVVKVRKRDGKKTAVVKKGNSETVEANVYDDTVEKGARVIVTKTGDSYQVVGRIQG